MIEEATSLWLIGATIGVGSLPVGYFLVVLSERIWTMCQSSNGANPVRMQCARPASDMARLIDGLAKDDVVFDGGELWHFDGDGQHFANEGLARWRRTFGRWASKGLRIKVILLEADGQVAETLRGLKAELKDSFDAVVLDQDAVPDVANDLATFHPTLFLSPGSNAAWIEGLHNRNSARVYDVEYLSPRVLRESAEKRNLFRACKERLDMVLGNSTPLVAQAA